MGTIKETAIKAVKLGEALLTARDDLDKIDVRDVYIAVSTNEVTKAELAEGAGVSPSKIGYHVLAWQAMSCGDDDGTPLSAMLQVAVAIHKTPGTGVKEASSLLATCNTPAAALRKMQGLVKTATGGDTPKAAKAPKAKKGTEVVAQAITDLALVIKGWDGTVTQSQAAALADMAAHIMGKVGTAKAVATPAAL